MRRRCSIVKQPSLLIEELLTMLKILGKRSSINVRKVLWTCEEAGLEYQQEDYGSGFQSIETPEFRALNPNSLVPVLRDDDFVLWGVEQHLPLSGAQSRAGRPAPHGAAGCRRG